MIGSRYIDPDSSERWRSVPVEVRPDRKEKDGPVLWRIFQGLATWPGKLGDIKVGRHYFNTEAEAQTLLDCIAFTRGWPAYKEEDS